MKLFFAIMLSFFAILPGASSQTEISGTVTDMHNKPLPGANIYLDGTYTGTTSDADGKFAFTSDDTGKLTLVAAFMGYEAFRNEIELSGAPVQMEIKLREAFNQLTAVTVTAGSYGSGDSDKITVMSSLDVVTTAGAMGDINAAMQTLPGTTVNGESGRLLVHGGSDNETGTYIDGILVPVPYTTSAPNMAVRGRFNPFMFSGTAFSTGGY